MAIPHYQTNEQFLEELTSGKEYQYFEGKQIDEVLKHIFNLTFSIVNQPEFEDTRKIMNMFSDFRNKALNNQNNILENQNETITVAKTTLNEIRSLKAHFLDQTVKYNSTMQQEQNELTIFSNPILQFYKDNKNNCNVMLSSKTNEPLFTITLIVKLTGDIARFLSVNQYFSYLMFAGKDDILDVVGIKLQNAKDGTVYSNIEQDYYGPTYRFTPFNVYTIESFPNIDEMKNMNMKIKIVSPKDILNISIQNEENDIIFDSKIYSISRKNYPMVI